MKKRKKSHLRKIIPVLLCAVFAVAAFAAVKVYFKEKPAAESGVFAEENGKNISQTADSLSLDAELVKVSCIGSVAEIDIVTPGLDTCSMRVAMYDLNGGKVLSETALKEGTWIRGQTENGFYAVEQSKKTLYIYDNSGKLKTEKTFSDKADFSSVCGVDEKEKYFIYTTAQKGELYVYDLKSGEEKRLDTGVFLRETLGFRDGVMYAAGMESSVVAIDVEDFSVRTEVQNPQLNLWSPYYNLGTTDYSFIVADKTGVKYVPFGSVDELAVGIGEDGFTTAVSREKGNTLRIYNLSKKTVAEADIDGTVEGVCYTGDGRLIVITGDAMQKKHSLSICDLKSLKTAPLTVNDTDLPEKKEPQIDIPEAKESQKANIVKGVPVLSQFPEFPTGCESVSTVTVLKFYGENITAAKFVDEYLPKSADFYYESGKRYGPSPYDFFIGNPRTAASYGCMAPVIEKALCDYFGGSERVKNTTGTELSELCSKYIDNGIPVIMWATINMIETNPKNSWYLRDGTRFSWPGNEHCLVLTGYDADSYYFNDPYAGKTVKYKKQTVKDRYAELGRQSVVILKKGE
ncbi:MAG: C39 family peptidase [Acutalibacteraceae bacterium]